MISHAGAVTFDQKDGHHRFLIISSSDGAHWVLPKGHIEPDESAEAAALRELQEEAGVLGEIIKPLSLRKFHRHGEEASVQYYLMRVMEVRQPDESRLLRWENEQSAFDLLTFEDARLALREGAADAKNLNQVS